MNNYVYTKEKLIEQFSQYELDSNLFCEDLDNVKSLLIDKEVPDIINKKYTNLSFSFVPEDMLAHLTVEKRCRSLSWRKHSDKGYTESREVEINLTGRSNNTNHNNHTINSLHSLKFERINGLQILGIPHSDNIIKSLIKVEENGSDNNLYEFKINNLRHIKDNNKIEWYIYSDVCQFEFGSFKTDKIIELYNNKIINQFTKIRLSPESYELITDELKQSPLESFYIKDLCNVFSIKEKCKYKAKPHEDEDSIYKSSLKRKTTYDYGYNENYNNDYYIDNKNKTPKNKRK